MKGKFARRLIIIGLLILYVLLIIYLCRFVGIDSDKASHLLQAKDILSGNFFMSDWNLTGVTFLTTDLVYYSVAYILFGLSYRAIYFAGGLMISSFLILAAIVCGFGKKEKLFSIICFFCVFMIPCGYLFQWFRVHTGSLFMCYLAFLLCHMYYDEKLEGVKRRKRILFAIFVVLLLGAVGDVLTILQGIIPILLLCVFKLLQDNKKRDNCELIVVSFLAIFLSQLLEKLYIYIGGANTNSYIAERTFSTVPEWGMRILTFIEEIMKLSGADFGGERVSSIWALCKEINFLFMLCALIVLIKIVWKILRGKCNKIDVLSVLLSFSILMSFFAYFFTQLSRTRYITIIPVSGMVLLFRNIDFFMRKVVNKKLLIGLIGLLVVCSFAGKLHEIKQYEYPTQNLRDYMLIEYLDKKGLEHGYASFWNASKLTVLSGENVKIRNIEKYGESYAMYNWFNKNAWFKEDTTFVLINNENADEGMSDEFGVSKENTIRFFGEPKEICVFDPYIIMIYDCSLSEKLSEHKEE